MKGQDDEGRDLLRACGQMVTSAWRSRLMGRRYQNDDVVFKREGDDDEGRAGTGNDAATSIPTKDDKFCGRNNTPMSPPWKAAAVAAAPTSAPAVTATGELGTKIFHSYSRVPFGQDEDDQGSIGESNPECRQDGDDDDDDESRSMAIAFFCDRESRDGDDCARDDGDDDNGDAVLFPYHSYSDDDDDDESSLATDETEFHRDDEVVPPSFVPNHRSLEGPSHLMSTSEMRLSETTQSDDANDEGSGGGRRDSAVRDIVLQMELCGIIAKVRQEKDSDRAQKQLSDLVRVYDSGCGGGLCRAQAPPSAPGGLRGWNEKTGARTRMLRDVTMRQSGPLAIVEAMLRHADTPGVAAEGIACLGKMIDLDDKAGGGGCSGDIDADTGASPLRRRRRHRRGGGGVHRARENGRDTLSNHIGNANGVSAILDSMRTFPDCFEVQLYGCNTIKRLVEAGGETAPVGNAERIDAIGTGAEGGGGNDCNLRRVVYGDGVDLIVQARDRYAASESIQEVTASALAHITQALAEAVTTACASRAATAATAAPARTPCADAGKQHPSPGNYCIVEEQILREVNERIRARKHE